MFLHALWTWDKDGDYNFSVSGSGEKFILCLHMQIYL